MRQQSFGLDIGTATIKSLALKKEGNGFAVESIAVAPSTPRGILSEALIDQQLLADAIKKMLSQAGISTPTVNISIPESQVYTKVIEMPQLSEQEASLAIRWEMERYIPLPLDQVRTDWQILERKEQNGKKTMNVLIVAAPIAIIEKYEKVISLAGLVIQSIETEILSVHRSVYPLINSSSPSLIVHIGASTTDVAIVKNGMINMVFSISLGGIAITRAVSIDLGIDLAQAEDFKKAYGLNQEVFEGKIGKSLNPILESIAVEIKKGILSHKEKNENEEIGQIVLSGGSALLPGINVFFTNTLGVQVVLGNSFRIYNIGNVPPEVLSESPGYNIVVGLALRDLT